MLAAALRPYTVAGNYGQLLDATSDALADGRFQVFEMKHLLAVDDRIALPVLLYLFRRIEQRLDGSPTLLVIDEAWMALTHSLFGARVNQWLLQLRKPSCASRTPRSSSPRRARPSLPSSRTGTPSSIRA